MSGMNYLALMELFKNLDAETVGLFTQFVMEAGRAEEGANGYVKRKLRVALAPEPPPPPKHVKVEVIEQDGRPVAGARVRRPR